MIAVGLADETVIDLHPLHIGGAEDGEHEVGRPETGVFVSLPTPGVDLLRWLGEGRTVGEVKARFATVHGEEPALEEFIDGMAECGFVRAIGEQTFDEEADAAPEARTGWRLLSNLPPERLAWLRSRPAVAAFVLVWLAVPTLLVLRPDLVPSPADATVHRRLLLNAASLVVLGWLLVFLHELAHLLAVRALGCTGSLMLSHRLHFLVAQTDMSGVRSQPRASRYGPYLAGMTCDMAVLLVCLLLRAVGVDSTVPGTIAFLVGFSLLFQFAFFMRTDVYFVFANWLRLGNLMGDTRRWLANVVTRMVGRRPRHDLSDVPPRELRIVRWYAVFCLVGVAAAVADLALLGLPVFVRFVGDAARQLGSGPSTADFWDSAVFIAVTALQFALLGWVVRRERRARQAPVAA